MPIFSTTTTAVLPVITRVPWSHRLKTLSYVEYPCEEERYTPGWTWPRLWPHVAARHVSRLIRWLFVKSARGFARYYGPLAALVIGGGCWYLGSWRGRWVIPLLRTKVIDWFSTVYERDIRPSFRAQEHSPAREVRDSHSHPLAAAIRTAANDTIDALAQKTGNQLYSISESQADQRRGLSGNRFFYTAKDLTSLSEVSVPQPHSDYIIKLSDVDFYIDDLPEFMSELDLPVLMYTFQPRYVRSATPNGQVYCDGNEIRGHYTGGAVYRHRLWDYDSDVMTCTPWHGLWTTTFLNESRLLPDDRDRRLVCCTPRRRTYFPANWLVSEKPLKRKVFELIKGWYRNVYIEDGQMMMSIGDSTMEAHMPVQVWSCLYERYTRSKDLQISSMESLLRLFITAAKETDRNYNMADCDPTLSATVAARAFSAKVPMFEGITPTAPPVADDRIQHSYLPHISKPILDDGKESMRSILEGSEYPICDTSVCPMMHPHSDESAVENRVEKVANGKEPPAYWNQYVREFVELFLRDRRGTVVPTETQEAWVRQDRPTQRSILRRADNWTALLKCKVSSFMKREAYGTPAAPRVISQLPEDLKLYWSCVMYAFTELLKTEPWYAFGKTPVDIATRVNEVCIEAMIDGGSSAKVLPTDYSAWDGRRSQWLADFEKAVLLAGFAPEHRQLVEQMHTLHLRAPARVGDTHYNCGTARLSGSPETSTMNSLDNAFIAFVAYRESGHSARGAYRRLGVYGGDDGLTANVEKDVYVRVASLLGEKLTYAVCAVGDPVPFLARYYIDPWAPGGVHSICDIPRQAGKLHLTRAPALEARDVVLQRKAMSYLLTDMATPVIGTWAVALMCRFELELAPCDKNDPDFRWWTDVDTSVQFPQSSYQTNLEAAARIWPGLADQFVPADEVLREQTFPLTHVLLRLENNDKPKIDVIIGDAVMRSDGQPPGSSCQGEQGTPPPNDSGQSSTQCRNAPVGSNDPVMGPSGSAAVQRANQRGAATATAYANTSARGRGRGASRSTTRPQLVGRGPTNAGLASVRNGPRGARNARGMRPPQMARPAGPGWGVAGSDGSASGRSTGTASSKS